MGSMSPGKSHFFFLWSQMINYIPWLAEITFSVKYTLFFENWRLKGLPLAIYRWLVRTAGQFRVGHCCLISEYCHPNFAWTDYTKGSVRDYTCDGKSVIFCCVYLYCSCHLAYLYYISFCRAVSSLKLKQSKEFPSNVPSLLNWPLGFPWQALDGF